MKAAFLKGIQLFNPKKSHLLALVLGGISVLAFAPFEFSPVILGSLAGLFWLWLNAESRFDGFKLGLWFGLGIYGVGVSWLFSSMYFYSGVPLVLAVLATFAFVFFLSLYTGLSGWLARYFFDKNRPGLMMFVLFPAVWVLAELLRGSVFGGFPFLQVGTTHLGTWLDGYAPVLGVLGVSWMVAMSAGLLLWFVTQRSWVGPSTLLCLLWSLGGLLQDVEWVQESGKPIDIALIQGNIPQDKKWDQKEFYPSLKTYVSLTKQNMDADVIVWPETAIATYYETVEKGALRTFIKDAKMLNTDILAGVITGEEGSDNYYNALVNLHNPEERYLKTHLVPFSEFFPLYSLFDFLAGLFDIPFATFSHGPQDQKPMILGGQPAALSICYEMAFGEELAQSLPEAKYMITVSNDAWFAHTFEPHQQVQDVKMRALELGREIARSTNTGQTIIVGVDGEIKASIEAYQQGVLRGTVQPYEGMTFYAEWKQLPILFMLFTVFGFILSKRYFLTGRFSKVESKQT
ncbi:MAG: apolipoprotein N-acyltransferase [Pseudomonadota bacterium]|nr:apolipoprotein N-acyltransferase [Pseudomonadota bacterium]